MPPMQPPGAPQPVQLNFKSPQSMIAYLLLDRAVADLNACASQLALTSNGEVAQQLQPVFVKVAAMRDEVLRADQGGIVIAGALPRAQ